MGGAVRLCKAPSCVVCSAGAAVWSIRIGGDIWRLCGLLGAFLASGSGFGDLVRGRSWCSAFWAGAAVYSNIYIGY